MPLGKWSDEDIERLLLMAEAVQQHGSGHTWQDVADALGRSAHGCRLKYAALGRAVKRAPKREVYVPEYGYLADQPLVLTSRPDNTFVFGVAGDRHHASKYHRNDVLADLYARFRVAGVDAVIDTGNWIDGECRFNKHSLVAAGLDSQLALMARETPAIDVPTYAVWGDDHEGWYAQREGMDVGKYAEMMLRRAGIDWYNLGYMEAHIVLRNYNTGASTVLCVMHPGGGSAYATSYRPQKIVEALEGGEKPAVILMGHYHKLEALNIRNVWTLQSGTCQDQTPFMRKRSIEAHVGGAILAMEQSPESGAIRGFTPQMVRFFNKGFYNNRWSLSGNINPTPRQTD